MEELQISEQSQFLAAGLELAAHLLSLSERFSNQIRQVPMLMMLSYTTCLCLILGISVLNPIPADNFFKRY